MSGSSSSTWLYHKYKLLKLLREDVLKEGGNLAKDGLVSREQMFQRNSLVTKIDKELLEHREHCLEILGIFSDVV